MGTRGFTLLELLVAVAIFAVVAALSWGGLDTVIRARHVIDDASRGLAGLQRALNRFDLDLSAALPHPVRNENGQIAPALSGDAVRIEFTTSLPATMQIGTISMPQRVVWRCSGDQLLRTHRLVSGPTMTADSDEQAQLDAISDCRIRYVAANGTFSDHWPLPDMPSDALPLAVEIAFAQKGQGEFLRLIELARTPERSQ